MKAPYDLADSPRKDGRAMGLERGRIPLALLAFTLLASQGGCAQWTDGVGEYWLTENESNVTKTPLPARPPAVRALSLAQLLTGGRLQPQTAATAPTAPRPTITTLATALSPEEQMNLRRLAEERSDVKEALGQPRRAGDTPFAFLSAERLERASDPCPRPGTTSRTPTPAASSSTPAILLTYYSYANNVGVVVCLRDQKVESVTPMKRGEQPPEGGEERKNADTLAREHPRLKGKVEALEPHVLLWEPHRGMFPGGDDWFAGWSPFLNDFGYSHRVLLLTYSVGDEGDPQYWAIVDLTAQKVLDADVRPGQP